MSSALVRYANPNAELGHAGPTAPIHADAGVMVRAGCFCGSLDEFRAACAETHGDGIHGREYAAAIQMIEAHALLWTPAEEAKEAA